MKNNDANSRNGLNLEQMVQTIGAITQNPGIAQFEFRASNQWVDGGENRSTIQGFYGACVEDESREAAFEYTNGEPPVLLGNNEGANPVEYLLHALAGCVTTTTILHATARGITIHKLSTELKGNIDLQGFLAMDGSVPVGYESIQIKMHIEADCSDEELDDLIGFARDHSPVCTTVCKPVPVIVERVNAAKVAA